MSAEAMVMFCVSSVFSADPSKKKNRERIWLGPRFREILEEYGYPLVVQHECGTEFRSCVAEWLKRKHGIVKTSRPYHPKILKKQMAFDLVQHGELGVNFF